MKLPKNQNFLVLLKNGSKWRIIVTITAIVTIVTVIAIVTIVIAFIFKLIMLS